MTAASDILTVDETVLRAEHWWSRLAGCTQGSRSESDVVEPWRIAAGDDAWTVSVALPNPLAATFVRWFGRRLVLWPDGIPAKRITSICSSSIGKRKDRQPEWFDALRTAVLRLDFATECLTHVLSTATADGVRRCCDLFGVERLDVMIGTAEPISLSELSRWIDRTVTDADEPHDRCMVRRAILSPPVVGTAGQGIEPAGLIPSDLLADSLLAAVGHRIVALKVRKGGRVDRILQRCLDDPDLIAPVLLADHQNVRQRDHMEHLVEAGAVRWLLEYDETQSGDRAATAGGDGPSDDDGFCNREGFDSEDVPTVPHGVLVEPEQWLTHWTRAHPGAWSGQDDDEFWDELILGCRTSDRSAFATLLKILQDRRLNAAPSGQGTRCVSFTAVPLTEFRQRRIFRRHKQQFDFELYGIAVRRDVLSARGAKPVVYTDRESPVTAKDDDVFLRQPATNAAGTIDWTAEQEWRFVGDLPLDEFAADELVVFVSNEVEVQRVRRVVDWPVVCVPPAR